jgi:pimeloyl-ACP methyl ester carboxylesterase
MGSDYQQLVLSAEQLANNAGFQRSDVSGGAFQFFSYAKITANEKVLSVYIEGDGRAWVNRHRVSLNPTPANPMSLKLAAADNQSASIVYLARPCQFRPTFSQPVCRPKYWTLERYSALVVDSYNLALDRLKQRYNVATFKLYGHSGGGALAVLIAAKRTDVAAIATVGANLDVQAFSELHQVSPLLGSLNPLDFVSAVRDIPQHHFFGRNDSSVPIATVARYRSQLTNQASACFTDISGVDHHQGWLVRWPGLLAKHDQCNP